jgi:hypothetical protein
MINEKLNDFISVREVRLVLEICQKYLASTHPSAAIMIELATREIDGNNETDRKFKHKAMNSTIHIKLLN